MVGLAQTVCQHVALANQLDNGNERHTSPFSLKRDIPKPNVAPIDGKKPLSLAEIGDLAKERLL